VSICANLPRVCTLNNLELLTAQKNPENPFKNKGLRGFALPLVPPLSSPGASPFFPWCLPLERFLPLVPPPKSTDFPWCLPPKARISPGASPQKHGFPLVPPPKSTDFPWCLPLGKRHAPSAIAPVRAVLSSIVLSYTACPC